MVACATPVEACDWFCSLFTTSASEITLTAANGGEASAASVSAQIGIGRATHGAIPCRFVWEERPAAEADTPDEQLRPFCEIACRGGSVSLLAQDRLCWQAGGPMQSEHLSGDRSAIEVGFDLFARRVVGGLIPVPDLYDLQRAIELSAALDKVRESGVPVNLAAGQWSYTRP